ncbi:MAG: hypothetical protein K6G04_07590 [Lachnospiraceae bacterium]|nr:hypothetical protein [Lachnospiraceae bacterium]
MKKIVSVLAGSFLALIMMFGMLPMQVQASAQKCYTVSFRAGNVGTFHKEAVLEKFPDAEVSDAYIKLSVPRGEDLTGYFSTDDDMNTFFSDQNILVTESAEGGAYSALPVEGFSVTDAITRNTDVVMSYCRIVNPARYVILYVNGDTGADIAAPIFGLGEADEKITATPLTIAGFHTTGTKTEVSLEAGKTAMVRFLYSQDEVTVYNTEITYTEGDTVYNDIIQRIGQTYTIPGGGNAAAAEEGEAPLVEVEENTTPLDNTTLENDNGLVTIEESETPLSNQVLGNTTWFAILAAVVVLSISGVAVALRIRKKAK